MLELQLEKFPELVTERLLLREHSVDDAPILFDMRRNKQVMQYIGRPQPTHIDEVIALINIINERSGKHSVGWVICLKDDPATLIGTIGFWQLDLANYRGEVGYILHPDHWRKGIVSEALKTVLDFGFSQLKLHSVLANIHPGNDASRQVLLRQGFIKEAYFRESYYFEGEFSDTEVYGLLKQEV